MVLSHLSATRLRGLLAIAAPLLVASGVSGCAPDSQPGPADGSVDSSETESGETDPDPEDTDSPVRDTDDRRPIDVDTSIWDIGGEDSGPADLSLSGITPARGPAGERTKFVLKGKGLTDKTAVYFGGRKADVRVVSGDLVGQTPIIQAPGRVPVKAQDPVSGTDKLPGGFTFTETLAFKSASPSSIPVSGGFQVTLTGSGFTSKTRASFDGTTALQHNFAGSGTLRVVAPPHAAGSADLRLTNENETIVVPDAVEYVQPVEIDEVRPATGSTGGGTRGTLRGAGFSSGMVVTFGGKRAQLQSVRSNGTRATVTTPAHATGLVDVAVSTTSGGGALAEDAFYYRSSANVFRLGALAPKHGEAKGGTRVRLVGSGLQTNGLQIDFGGTAATVRRQGTGWAVVSTPGHAPGTVDVTIRDGAGNSSTRTGAFTYHKNLNIGTVTPNKGPVSGGTSVTLRGGGFQNVSKVQFGGIDASFTVKNKSEIRATAPPHSAGAVDIRVVRGEIEATAPGAFRYRESLEVYGLSPARGSVAGNTYVQVRGKGFASGTPNVAFGSKSAKRVKRLDSHTLAVRTPAHSAGRVDVRVERGGQTVRAPSPFHFFDPTGRDGGTWGGSVEGSVNVAVYSENGGPIPGAFVMLSTNPKSPYTAWTNPDGLATLSGSNVFGPQTITVTARGFSAATFQRLDASNVTVYLSRAPVRPQPNPGDAGGGSDATPASDAGVDVPDIQKSDVEVDVRREISRPDGRTTPSPPIDASYDIIEGPQNPPPPEKGRPVFTGQLTGLDKIAVVGPNERTFARVYTTKKGIRSRNPPYGSGNRLFEDGSYRLKSRTGDLALVAVGGVLNTKTREFEPHRMGVKRYQTAVRGKTYQRDIDLNIPLDQTLTFKVANPPFDSPGGPDTNVVHPFLDFGFEGVFGQLELARGTSKLVSASGYPEFKDELSDLELATIGGSYTAQRGQRLVPPQSVALSSGTTSIQSTLRHPKLVGVPKITSPPSGQSVQNDLIKFELTSSNEPDFYQLQLYNRDGTVVWDMFAPGTARSIRLPNFPSFASQPKRRRPVPYPAGQFFVRIFAIEHPNASYDNFGYSDLSLFQWSAYAYSSHTIEF